jgi:Uncharacterized protein predicted to be involved in DNA repair (RAMP superfamily)
MSIDYFAELEKQTDLQKTEEFVVRYHRLVADDKKKEAASLRVEWGKRVGKISVPEPEHELWQMIAKPKLNLAYLPYASFFLQFTFKLAKPYISKDDNPFYIIDNPIVRDKVFQLPMVRSTGWKGNLYSALWQLGHDKQDDEQMQRLFGETRGEEGGWAGRLFFYPTFFTQTSLEIINPHDRKRRVGKNPILFESVPAGAQGTFSLLYVPFDLIGKEESYIKQQALADLELIAEGLSAMFLTYGFSAKRTSGYGVAEETVSNGFVQIRIEETQSPPLPVPSAAAPNLPKYLQAPGKLKDEYLNPDGTFRERSEAELKGMSKSDRQEYEKARRWWEREGKALASQPPAEVEPWLKREFGSFAELNAVVKELLEQQTGAQ